MKNINWDKEFPEVPDAVHRAVVNTLEGLKEHKKTGKKSFRGRKLLLLAAALAALSGMTVAAAELVKWNRQTVERFGTPPEEVQEKLAAEGIIKEQTQSVTDQGITVTALQTLQDEQRVYVLLEITAKEAVIDSNSLFLSEGLPLVTDDPEAFQGIGHNFVPDTPERVMQKRGTYEIDALKTTDRAFNADSVTISFDQFSWYTYEGASDETLHTVDGSWELTLPLNDASRYTKSYDINRTAELSGVPVKIRRIALSPLSVEIRYDLTDTRTLQDTAHAKEPDCFMQELFVTGFLDRDGNEIECGFGASGGHYDPEKNEDILVIALNVAVDPENVAAILLGNDRVPVELK